MKSFTFKFVWSSCAGALLALALMMPAAAMAADEEQFTNPDAAVKALASAAEAKDHQALATIFGPGLHNLVSADPVQASSRFDLFVQRVSEKTKLVQRSEDKMVLEIGNDAWPFPIPLVRQNGEWFFDTAAGAEEILNRRIGANELGAIRVCHAYVQAQREYASEDRIGDGVLQYSQHLRSTAGKHDGLYWHAGSDEEESPLGPLIAESHGEGYHKTTKILNEPQSPYRGYYFKILTRQGRHAVGGKYNYIINGRMIAGFALVAWPAQWDNSGVMTFIVNQEGKVFEKNLGPKTDSIARSMTTFDPDSSWKPAWEP